MTHGTVGGYHAHRARAEKPCEECLRARSMYTSWWRFRRGDQRRLQSCAKCGSVFPEHLCSFP